MLLPHGYWANLALTRQAQEVTSTPTSPATTSTTEFISELHRSTSGVVSDLSEHASFYPAPEDL
jgi:hypothetical protein